MNTKHALTLKGFAALLLGVTVLATSCKKDEESIPNQNGISDSTLTSDSKPEDLTMGTLTPTSTSGLIFESLLEKSQTGFNAWEGGDWNGVEAANANSITRSTEKAKAGSYSAKFVLNKTDSYVANSLRAELTDWNGRMSNPKSERWYGLSMFLPNSYVADTCEEIVFQWHGVNATDLDGNYMGNPPIAMLTINGRWWLMLKGSPKIDLGAYNKDVWTDWVLHIKFSPTSDGLLEIWKNGQKVLTKSGQNTHNDVVGNYFKLGIYKYGWKDGYPSTTTTRTLFFDEIRTGNETSSYAQVAPRNSSTTTTPTTTTPTTTSPTTTTPTSTNPVVFAVNSGGSSFKASNGITYQADKNFSGGSVYKTSSAIANTNDDVLYQSERYGKFGYAIPVTNGTYEITFKFAEIFQQKRDARKFDIIAEGSEVISNLDIFAVAGFKTKYDVVKTVTVSDGILNIQTRTDIDNAKISAFHVTKK